MPDEDLHVVLERFAAASPRQRVEMASRIAGRGDPGAAEALRRWLFEPPFLLGKPEDRRRWADLLRPVLGDCEQLVDAACAVDIQAERVGSEGWIYTHALHTSDQAVRDLAATPGSQATEVLRLVVGKRPVEVLTYEHEEHGFTTWEPLGFDAQQELAREALEARGSPAATPPE